MYKATKLLNPTTNDIVTKLDFSCGLRLSITRDYGESIWVLTNIKEDEYDYLDLTYEDYHELLADIPRLMELFCGVFPIYRSTKFFNRNTQDYVTEIDFSRGLYLRITDEYYEKGISVVTNIIADYGYDLVLTYENYHDMLEDMPNLMKGFYVEY